MKTKSVKTQWAPPCYIKSVQVCLAILISATLFFSCGKNAATTAQAKQGSIDMGRVAVMVDGQAVEGCIATNTDDENNLAIVFNKGNKYVLIQKIPGLPIENADEIKSATLITSKYGVIIKDETTNKVWLFANNDEESLQKFESVKQQLGGSYVSITVFGTTVINS